MRVLHLVATVGRASGGLGLVSLGYAREQLSLGLETTIWCLDSPALAAEVASTCGLEGRIVTSPVLGPSLIGFSPAAERMAGAGREYDILHQHGIWMANSRVTNRWRATYGRPTVVAPHGSLNARALSRSAWKKRLASLWYETKNLRLASCLHASSDFEVVSFRSYGLRNPIAVIPNGIPDSWIHSTGDGSRFRRRYSIPSGKRLFLFLSRLHPHKGLPLLLEALAHIRQDLCDWHLVLVGQEELGHRRELELLAEKLGIGDLVQFVEPLFGSEKRDAFAAADLFVLPTYSEGFGMAVAEALGAGVPALTTRGAPWEDLQTYRCGWWIEMNTAAIRDALLDVIQRPKGEMMAMGQRGKTLIAERYTWRIVAQKSLMLYEWLLGRGERPDFVVVD